MNSDVIRSIFGLFAAIAVISGVFLVLGAFSWAAQRVLRNL